jgi:hypothetical protein
VDWYDAAVEYRKRTFAHDGRLSSLPVDWQRELVALMLLDREVNNGAYLQFLANYDREVYAYASQALKRIGARQMAEVIDRCQALVDEHFPCEGKSYEERGRLLPNPIIDSGGRTIKETGSVLPEPVLDRVYELSYEYMKYPDDVGRLAQGYYGPLIEGDRLTRL